MMIFFAYVEMLDVILKWFFVAALPAAVAVGVAVGFFRARRKKKD